MLAFRLLCLQLVCLTIDLAIADINLNITFFPPTDPVPSITTTPTIPRLPPGYTHYSDIRAAYKVSDDKRNWYGAKQSCISEGGRLAIIDTVPKIHYVKGTQNKLDWVWTGIYRQPFGYENWMAVDGSELSPNLPWTVFAPLGIFGDCVTVSGLLDGLGRWPCTMIKKYVCEIPDGI